MDCARTLSVHTVVIPDPARQLGRYRGIQKGQFRGEEEGETLRQV